MIVLSKYTNKYIVFLILSKQATYMGILDGPLYLSTIMSSYVGIDLRLVLIGDKAAETDTGTFANLPTFLFKAIVLELLLFVFDFWTSFFQPIEVE